MEALVLMEELFNAYPEKKLRYRAKGVQSAKYHPKVMKCCSAPRVILVEGEVTEGKKRRFITDPLPSQPRDLTSRMAPTKVAKDA